MRHAAIIVLTAISFFVSGNLVGYKQGKDLPPFKLLQAKETPDKQYRLMLQDHSGNSFFLSVPIEKALALGIDTNEIILLANQ